jgi:hypothetical protein
MSSVMIKRSATPFLWNLKLKTVELIILISQIQEIILVESESVHWNIRNPFHDGTMVKARWYERETTIVRWWNNDGTMVKQQRHNDENMMVRRWKHAATIGGKYDGTMMKLRWHDDETAILLSPSCHRIIVISPSCHRCSIIPSRFSPLNYRV